MADINKYGENIHNNLLVHSNYSGLCKVLADWAMTSLPPVSQGWYSYWTPSKVGGLLREYEPELNFEAVTFTYLGHKSSS